MKKTTRTLACRRSRSSRPWRSPRPRRSRCRRSCRPSARTSRCRSRRSPSRSCRTASSVWLVQAQRLPARGRRAGGARRRHGRRSEGRGRHHRAAGRHASRKGPRRARSRAIAEELQARGRGDRRERRAPTRSTSRRAGLGSGVPKIARGDGRRRAQRLLPRRRGGAREGQRAPGPAGARVDAGVPGPEGARPRRLRRPPVPRRRAQRRRRSRRRPRRSSSRSTRGASTPSRALLVVVGEFDAAAVAAARRRGTSARGAGARRGARRHAAVAGRAGHAAAAGRAARRLGAVADRDRPPRRHRHRSRLLPAAGRQHDLRGLLRQPPRREHPRGQGLHLLARRRPIAARAKGGLLTVRADVRTEVTGATLTEMFYELDRMGATLPTRRGAVARQALPGRPLPAAQPDPGAPWRSTLASNWVNGLPPEALGEFVSKVNAVSAEQVRAAGRAFFPSSRQTVVVVGDEAKVKAELAQFGEATVVKP